MDNRNLIPIPILSDFVESMFSRLMGTVSCVVLSDFNTHPHYHRGAGMPSAHACLLHACLLICGYLLRSLLPFLTFLLWNITGR